VSDQDNGFMN